MDHLTVHERRDLLREARISVEQVTCPKCWPRLGRRVAMKIIEQTTTTMLYHCTHCGLDVRLHLSHL